MRPIPLPQPLKIVAYLFIIGGICSALSVIIAFLQSRININLGVFGIFIGMGLLRLNPNSLRWAMLFTWFGLIVTPIFTLLSLFNPGYLTIFGLRLGQAPPGLGFIIGLAACALVYWEYQVLTSYQVRQLFR